MAQVAHRKPATRVVLALAALCLALFAAQAVTSLREKSVTCDESVYIAAGYYHWKTGSFRFNTTNPPLMKLLAALPLLAYDLELPEASGDPATWSGLRESMWSRVFLYGNRVDAERILFAARLPVVALGVLLGIYVFAWSRRLYGERAALFALLLYAFSPNILAHTRLATHDLGVTAFGFAAAYHFWSHVHRPRATSLLASAAAFSAAILTKTTAFFLIPIAILYLAIAVRGRDPLGVWTGLRWVDRIDARRVVARQLVSLGISGLAVGGIALLALNAGYLFEGSFRPLPLPEPFLELVRFQLGKTASGNTVYLLGEHSREGWWYMMLLAFAMKSPVPLLCLVAFAFWRLAATREIRDAEWLCALVFAVLMALFSYLKGISVGLRYVLPTYPFLHVLASRSLREGAKLPAWGRIALAGLAIWYVVGALRIHPDYLAHFNELVGGPDNGHRLLADSNLDWGQDLPALKRYVDEQGIERIRLAYFGAGHAPHHGIEYEYLPSIGLDPLQPGEQFFWHGVALPPLDLSRGPMAVSATLVAGVFLPGYYAPLAELEPVAQIGHSILIYGPHEAEENP